MKIRRFAVLAAMLLLLAGCGASDSGTVVVEYVEGLGGMFSAVPVEESALGEEAVIFAPAEGIYLEGVCPGDRLEIDYERIDDGLDLWAGREVQPEFWAQRVTVLE
ncbi:MAG: hypothetical protein IJO37_00035 [Ruminiclostridium sp.]|nr:hypothetical protein [Ruminiclostridium sp.]